ncbi:MAG: heme-binding beta-barrel domain-containing protein [Gammaproteobacteria bacterium]|nr:heme-binding beta-barrel domain-containing protein [Gammaproteobacteria bacterium]
MGAQEELEQLGPLAALAGVWEGDKGNDRAPAADRGLEVNDFRERMSFEPIGLVDNHEQLMYGLRYATMAWEIGDEDPFHEEVGYWLWEPAEQQVLRCFIVPRGISVIAGGTVAGDASSFELVAEVGSDTYGICSNRFLDREFRTLRFEYRIDVHDNDSFSYDQDTQIEIKGKDELFHHRDANTLRRVS